METDGRYAPAAHRQGVGRASLEALVPRWIESNYSTIAADDAGLTGIAIRLRAYRHDGNRVAGRWDGSPSGPRGGHADAAEHPAGSPFAHRSDMVRSHA